MNPLIRIIVFKFCANKFCKSLSKDQCNQISFPNDFLTFLLKEGLHAFALNNIKNVNVSCQTFWRHIKGIFLNSFDLVYCILCKNLLFHKIWVSSTLKNDSYKKECGILFHSHVFLLHNIVPLDISFDLAAIYFNKAIWFGYKYFQGAISRTYTRS